MVKQKVFKRQVIAGLMLVTLLVSEGSTMVMAKPVNGEYDKVNTVPIKENIVESAAVSPHDEMEVDEQDVSHDLKLKLESKKYNKNEKIRLEFKSDEEAIYQYEAEGIELVNTMGEMVEVEVSSTEGFGKIDVYAEYTDGIIEDRTVHTYTQEDKVYLSDVSMDQAWFQCMEEKYNQGLITMEEWEDAYAEFSRTYMTVEMPSEDDGIALMSADNGFTVKGRLRWELEDGTILPLRYTKVELRYLDIMGSSVFGTTYTDDNGNYEFEIECGELAEYDVFIRWYSQSTTFAVKQDLTVLEYSSTSRVEENVGAGDTIFFNYRMLYDEDINGCNAFYVQQGMVVAQRFAQAMGMKTNNFINVVYPSGIGFPKDNGFCWGELAENCFSVIGKEAFNNVDLLCHEYGHFVEVSMGVYGPNLDEIIFNNPNHHIDADHFTDKEDKAYAMKLTWSESWASAFSLIAQEYYSSEYQNVPGFADKVYMENYEVFLKNPNSCEAQEKAVTAFLWDLYDSGSNESYDNIGIGARAWWEYTTKTGTYTLEDFVEVVESYYSGNRGGIGELLGAHQISPSEVTIKNYTKVSASVAPQLSWRVNGSKDHPNDIFEVVFYDAYGKLITTSGKISSSQTYNTTFNYTVPLGTWTKVLQSYGGDFRINIMIRSYRTGDFTSGPYMSKYIPIDLKIHKTLSINASNRYTENKLKLDKNGYCDYTIIFGTSSYKLFQTFGVQDTKMELYSASGTLLASNDDGGNGTNSLINYYCTSGTVYRLRVKFYSSYYSGYTKLAITPARGARIEDASYISQYEDIHAVKGYTGYTWNTYAQKDLTRVITFTPPSSGSYTFTIESDYDTYIYVIDPRSTESLTGVKNYNDDSGEGYNPLLTTSLTAGVPYLIIYSTYNPNSLTQSIDLSVKISRD